ncbi:MAG TPA: 50S ribosomal protein L23 [bacterium]|jgi:large subunit ribosomal protein L23|nr:50S ribosomal protein L23 [bacterium]HNT65338.1 50S ribosomal protein L23 [bacterium]HOX86506.1 50S ribosomal protein L23 [bacterium]HPG46532.1 50S ribosomal protein L23 [bacterium]HPM98412.1 50S ribosomal protein L23 [bacterium]
MKNERRVLVRPLLTEKMLKLQETQGKYAFVVSKSANKIEIKRAVEQKFDVSVDAVSTINVHGKRKQLNTRRGITHGRRASWKKAIVTLREGDSIDFFAGTK